LSLNVNMKEAKYFFFSPEISFGEKYSFKKSAPLAAQSSNVG